MTWPGLVAGPIEEKKTICATFLEQTGAPTGGIQIPLFGLFMYLLPVLLVCSCQIHKKHENFNNNENSKNYLILSMKS